MMAERGSRAYEATMRELPPATMTKQQERELSVRALAGDIDAANELAAGHMRFAAMIARRYARAPLFKIKTQTPLSRSSRNVDGRPRFYFNGPNDFHDRKHSRKS